MYRTNDCLVRDLVLEKTASKQKLMPQPASAKNARAARLAKRSGSPSVAPVTEKQKQGVLLLIRATQALYDTVGAHGYQRREGKIATFPF